MKGREKEAVLLRIYVRESELLQGKSLYAAIVEEARKRGLACATVLRGIEGSASEMSTRGRPTVNIRRNFRW